MSLDFIPVNEPLLDGNELVFVKEAIETGWISSEGPCVTKFEEEFSWRVGKKFGVAVANGTAALDVAVAALEITEGDEVIMPAFTIISCATAIVRSGAKPVLVDCNPITWNMNVSEVEAKITPRTRAIMVVHIYGLPVDMEPLFAIANKHGLAVIEDAAEVIGQEYKGRPCGSFGTISTFSFYPNKHITTGEGGMCVTDDPALAERCRSLRNLCFRSEQRFVHEELGWNYRMTNLQAALGCAQLERLDSHVAKKRKIGCFYTELLRDISGLRLPVSEMEYAENIYWVYGIVLNDDVPFDASEAMKRLGEKGIGTRPFFWPMHEQPVFKRMGFFEGDHYPISERIARRGFYLPSGLSLTSEQIEHVAKAVIEILC
ncbi:MAG TPA: DegT/DnrJ/EryC1/StrS family aminotransferase [Gammaproteobacteria bacterium]|nr:DegT/DnrJ/EryC1/StrS family aminotransferase [Gammaproteobacteria bacterium]